MFLYSQSINTIKKNTDFFIPCIYTKSADHLKGMIKLKKV